MIAGNPVIYLEGQKQKGHRYHDVQPSQNSTNLHYLAATQVKKRPFQMRQGHTTDMGPMSVTSTM